MITDRLTKAISDYFAILKVNNKEYANVKDNPQDVLEWLSKTHKHDDPNKDPDMIDKENSYKKAQIQNDSKAADSDDEKLDKAFRSRNKDLMDSMNKKMVNQYGGSNGIRFEL